MVIYRRVAKLCLSLSAVSIATAAIVRRVDTGNAAEKRMSGSATYAPTSQETPTVPFGVEMTVDAPETPKSSEMPAVTSVTETTVVPAATTALQPTEILPQPPTTAQPPSGGNTPPPVETTAAPYRDQRTGQTPTEITPPPGVTELAATARQPGGNTPPPGPSETTSITSVVETTTAVPEVAGTTSAVPTERPPSSAGYESAIIYGTAAAPTARPPNENTPPHLVETTVAVPEITGTTAAVPTERPPEDSEPDFFADFPVTAAVPTARPPVQNKRTRENTGTVQTASSSGAGSGMSGGSRNRAKESGTAEKDNSTTSPRSSAASFSPGNGVKAKDRGEQVDAAENDDTEKRAAPSKSTGAGTAKNDNSGRRENGVVVAEGDRTEKRHAGSSSSEYATRRAGRPRLRAKTAGAGDDYERTPPVGSSAAAPTSGSDSYSKDSIEAVDSDEDIETEENSSALSSTKAGPKRDATSRSRGEEVDVDEDDEAKAASVGSGAASGIPERGFDSKGSEGETIATEGNVEEDPRDSTTDNPRPRSVGSTKTNGDEVDAAEDREGSSDVSRRRRRNPEIAEEKGDNADEFGENDIGDTGSKDPKRGRNDLSQSSDDDVTEDVNKEDALDSGSANSSPESVIDSDSLGEKGNANEDDSVKNPADSLDSDDPSQESGGSGCVSHQWLVNRGYTTAHLVHPSPPFKSVLCPTDDALELPCGTEHHAVSISSTMMSYGELCSTTNCRRSVERVNSLWAFHQDSRTGISVTSDSKVQLYMHDTRYPKSLQMYLHFTLSAARKLRYGLLTLCYPTRLR